jgi:hypothetical protein
MTLTVRDHEVVLRNLFKGPKKKGGEQTLEENAAWNAAKVAEK